MTDTAELVIQLIDEVQRTRGRLASVVATFRDPEGPQGLGMTVLTAVVGSAHPPTVPQIGRSLGYPRQTIQRHADELVERGLIAFIPNPDHTRAGRLIPTEEGRAIHGRINAKSLRWAADFSRDMDPAQLFEAVRLLRLVRERLEDQARHPAVARSA